MFSIRVDTKTFSITIPSVGWTVRKELPAPYILALVSTRKDRQDKFNENIVIYEVPLKEGQTLDEVVNTTVQDAKINRPDFTVLKESVLKADSLDIRRQVCRMTFPEFISKNIQYFIKVNDSVYVLTASIPEEEFQKWEAVSDAIIKSFRVNIKGFPKQ